MATLVLLVATLASCARSSTQGAPATGGSTTNPLSSPSAPAATTSTPTAGNGQPSSSVTTAPAAPGSPSAAQAAAAPCGWASRAPSSYQHVVWIWMENHTWGQVLGDRSAAPYEVALAARCATATHFDNVGSPSLPNYIGATSGGTQGISDDGSPSSHPLTVDNLFRQVRSAGGTERSYEESMTQPCQQGSAGDYAVKHNPAVYYTGDNGADRSACARDDVPFPQLSTDLASGHLPALAFVTPNLCDDTHDCAVSRGDAWLSRELPAILGSAEYRQGTTAVVVVWDEYSPVPNIVIAPAVRPGTVVTMAFNDYALLRTTEDLLGLPGHLGAAAQAPSLRAAFGL